MLDFFQCDPKIECSSALQVSIHYKMSIPVSVWTPNPNGDGLVDITRDDDWMMDNDYEEIYNGVGRCPGVDREYMGQPGIFYQTYGNGGGPGGWGGYWIREGGEAVWQVEGEVFTYLDGKTLSLRSVPYFPSSLHWWCKIV